MPLDSRLAPALAERYELERELGHGGMATVYLARDLRHDRQVAVKVLRPDLAAVLGRERFLAEIRLTAKLDHPHILTLIDSGENDGFVWYVVPYVRGESLRRRLEREGQLGVSEALAIASQVAGALEYAHHQGVIHRDIKPENILLHEGEAVMADFGIALAVKEAAGNRLTETGLSLGTPQYMSPEQATGDRQLDARSDVYSLGAVLYEMLAGEPPHSGPTVQAVIAKLMTERPTRLRVVRDTVPEGIDTAVAKALAKVPADRFGSAAEFQRALEPSSAAQPSRPRFSPRSLGLAFGAGVLVLIAWLTLSRDKSATDLPHVQRQLTFTGNVGSAFGPGTSLAISPDGGKVAYVSGGRSLMVQAIDGGEPITLVADARFLLAPRWTRDGLAIVFGMFRDSLTLAATYVIPASGGVARKVLNDQTPVDIGPDSVSLVRVPLEKRALEVVNLRSGRITRLVPLADSLLTYSPFWSQVRVAPNGRWAAVSAGIQRWLVALEGSATASVRALPEGQGFAWSAGGEFLYFLTGAPGAVDLQRVAVDSRSGRVGVQELVMSLPNATDFDVGRSGRLVYLESHTSSQVYTWSVPAGIPVEIDGLRAVTEGTRPAGPAAISEDGARIAFSRQREADVQLEVIPFEGGSPMVVAASPSPEQNPSWSPDGSLLAFFRDDSLMVVTPSADATPHRVGTARGSGPAAWAADGQTLAYLQSKQGPVVIADVATGHERTIPIPDSVGATLAGAQVLSPDGRQLILGAAVKAQDWWTLWHLEVANNRWQHLSLPFGEWLPFRWDRDGWIYLSNDRAVATDHGGWRGELWRLRLTPSRAELVARLPEVCEYFPSRAFSQSGRHAACRSARTEADLYAIGKAR